VNLTLVAVVVVALFFDFTNGFHDAANAVATTVSTRALPPRIAVGFAALLNFAGAFISLKVATTVGKGIVDPNVVTLKIVLAGVVGAIGWNLTHTAQDELFAAIEGTAFHTRVILDRMSEYGALTQRVINGGLGQVRVAQVQPDDGAHRGQDPRPAPDEAVNHGTGRSRSGATGRTRRSCRWRPRPCRCWRSGPTAPRPAGSGRRPGR